MQVRQTLYPQGSGQIKLVKIEEEIITVVTRNDGDLIYRRDRSTVEIPHKVFRGKRIVPADRG